MYDSGRRQLALGEIHIALHRDARASGTGLPARRRDLLPADGPTTGLSSPATRARSPSVAVGVVRPLQEDDRRIRAGAAVGERSPYHMPGMTDARHFGCGHFGPFVAAVRPLISLGVVCKSTTGAILFRPAIDRLGVSFAVFFSRRKPGPKITTQQLSAVDFVGCRWLIACSQRLIKAVSSSVSSTSRSSPFPTVAVSGRRHPRS